MKAIIYALLTMLCLVAISDSHAWKRRTFRPEVVYRSGDLVITRISENAFEHTSFLQTQDFGKVPCNGLIVRGGNEVAIFDTPADDTSSEELIRWVKETLHCSINAIIPTHFHNDCLGGLRAFHYNDIPSYASFRTIALARANNFVVPQNGFDDSLVLNIGGQKVTAWFFGEGHTKDNVVGYFPAENIMFGGCLIKELGASKGYLGDANVDAWPNTVEKVKKAYPGVAIVVPGHGAYGGKKLLDYTIRLFRVRK